MANIDGLLHILYCKGNIYRILAPYKFIYNFANVL